MLELDRAYTKETAIQNVTLRVTSRPWDTLGSNARRLPETEDGGGKLLTAYALRGAKGLSK
jgi:hypothetical protein